jgi:hypothetical protein
MTSAASALYGQPADFAPLVTNNKTRYNTQRSPGSQIPPNGPSRLGAAPFFRILQYSCAVQ